MIRSAPVEQPPSNRSRTSAECLVSAPRSRRLQVLLVDDEIEPLLPLADALRRAGMVTTIATSDEEALFDVRMSQPDVVVLDAELAGRTLLVGIRTLVPALPLVLMTRIPAQDPKIAAMLAIAGVTYIDKPVQASRLLELVAEETATETQSSDGRVERQLR